MIHNIEERQRLYERQSPASGTLSEEELAQLIAQVEANEMLHAPVHIKENVLFQVKRQGRTAQKLQLFTYRAKVLAGMAAALAVLFTVPVDGEKRQEPVRNGIFEQVFQEEQADTDEIRQGALERQRQMEQAWQEYREAQARENAREEYFRSVENKIRNSRNYIF